MKNLNQKLKDVLIKKATGFSVEESVCEYGVGEDSEVKLIKKKVSTKYFPPDISAINLLIDKNVKNEFDNLTDEELENEKKRIFEELKEEENETCEN